MKNILLAASLLAAVPVGVHAQERREPDLLLRRPDRSYEAPAIPRSSGRLEVDRGSEQRYRGVYDSSGRRIGTVETTPYGGTTFRDNQGIRR